MPYDHELFVIGAGSGGVRASRMAATFGARVVVAEAGDLGGTCVNRGCVPKKLLVHGSEYGEVRDDAAAYGWTYEGARFDWATLRRNKDVEISRLNRVYQRILHGAGVKIVHGRARIVDEHTVEVDGQRFHTERILICTGGRPQVPEVPGAELGITSREAFHLETLPQRVVVVGGGYIGLEFAGIFHGLGSHVSVVTRGPFFLRGFDEDVRRSLSTALRDRGIDLRYHCEVSQIEEGDQSLHVHLSDGVVLHADAVLWAVGRVPNLDGLGLEALGVERTDSGALRVNEGFQTSVPSVYALGDIIEGPQLTPVALEEGMVFAKRLYGSEPTAVMDYDAVPTAVFSQPEVGTVGLSEHAARERGRDVEIYRTSFRPLKHTLTGRVEKAMMKLVVCCETDEVLGVHMVGPHAAEIVQGFAVALRCGATKAQFDATIGIHPTSAEEFVTLRTPVPKGA